MSFERCCNLWRADVDVRDREEERGAQGEAWGSTPNTRCSVKCFCRQHLFKKIIKERDQTTQKCLPGKHIPGWPVRWGRKAWQWFSAEDWSKILPRSSLLIARSLISPELYDKWNKEKDKVGILNGQTWEERGPGAPDVKIMASGNHGSQLSIEHFWGLSVQLCLGGGAWQVGYHRKAKGDC